MIGRLAEAARHEFWLHSPMGDSDVLRIDHLRSIAKQTGEEPPALDGPDIPAIARHVWEWFKELHASRSDGPIPHREIKAWAELTRTPLAAWEVKALKRIDAAWLQMQQERIQRQRKQVARQNK